MSYLNNMFDKLMLHRFLKTIILILLGLNFTLLVSAAPVQLSKQASSKNAVLLTSAWVRATADGQTVGAAYVNLMSAKLCTLIAVETDVANSVEIHHMSMDNGVMKMRHLETLTLPKGEMIRLAPGGFHLMLFDLKKPLKVGENVTFKLTFRAKNSRKFAQTIVMPIRDDAPG